MVNFSPINLTGMDGVEAISFYSPMFDRSRRPQLNRSNLTVAAAKLASRIQSQRMIRDLFALTLGPHSRGKYGR
jgi:hypothetical protein